MKRPTSSNQRNRFPPKIVSHAVWIYYRFCLSFQEVEEILAERFQDCHLPVITPRGK